MNSSEDIDLLATFKRLQAENKSQEDRLQEYAKIINSRDNEIEMLQSMLSYANEYRSTLDNKVKELNDLQRNIGELQHQADQAAFMATGRQQQVNNSDSIERQFENLKIEYANLQAQLTDLQTQLLDMNNRNLLLQQQASRIAELESLLANAEEERDEMYKNSHPKG